MFSELVNTVSGMLMRRSACVWSSISRTPSIVSLCSPSKEFARSPLLYETDRSGNAGKGPLAITECEAVFDPKYNTVYSLSGHSIPCSVLMRGIHRKRFNAPHVLEQDPPKATVPCGLYGGILFDRHYGHFLTESLSRLWPLVDAGFQDRWKDLPIIFRMAKNTSFSVDTIAPYVKQVLEALGILNRIYIPTEPVRIKKLLIPEPSIINNLMTHESYTQTMQYIGDKLISENPPSVEFQDKKIYLSRSKLKPHMRKLGNERKLERILRDHGYCIVHPQELDFIDQISLFRSAEEVVGPIGSAFHTFPLAGNSNVCIKYLLHFRPDCPVSYYNTDAALEIKSTGIYCIFEHPMNLKRMGVVDDQIIDLDRAIEGILYQ